MLYQTALKASSYLWLVNDISAQTMEAKSQKGLYFIGEVIDVTGHLGGYNFQWAWSSGFVAGQDV